MRLEQWRESTPHLGPVMLVCPAQWRNNCSQHFNFIAIFETSEFALYYFELIVYQSKIFQPRLLCTRQETRYVGFEQINFCEQRRDELAHIRSRDVDVTYATVALWRVFLFAVLIPHAGYDIFDMTEQSGLFRAAGLPGDVRSLILSADMVVLVYLARADVLRTREHYADLDARRWGADPATVRPDTPEIPSDSRSRRAIASFGELFRTHPTWSRRGYALVDPADLFGMQALPMFLTGGGGWRRRRPDDPRDHLAERTVAGRDGLVLAGGRADHRHRWRRAVAVGDLRRAHRSPVAIRGVDRAVARSRRGGRGVVAQPVRRQSLVANPARGPAGAGAYPGDGS